MPSILYSIHSNWINTRTFSIYLFYNKDNSTRKPSGFKTEKTLDLRYRKVALSLSHNWLKSYLRREMSWELTEKMWFQERFASWKQMFGIEKVLHFPPRNIYLCILWYLGVLKTFGRYPKNIPGGVSLV